MQHEAHRRDPDPGQWHMATNYQDDRGLSSQVPINNRGRDPLSDISLNATNIHDANQQHRTGGSISDTLRPERTGFGRISAILNYDSNTPAISKYIAIAENL
jgi:hypothetical protein